MIAKVSFVILLLLYITSAKRRKGWQIENPKGKSIDKFREVREKIEERVKELLEKTDS